MDQFFEALRYAGNICISGLTAAGKTTHSHLLAGELGLTYVSGSQIQLNFMGVSPIQTRDFWITPEAKKYWNEEQFNRIDAELLRIETRSDGIVFDTSTMPWRHKKPALCIWLESTLESRCLKSMVSHRGRGNITASQYPKMIKEKDAATVDLYKQLYDIDIGKNLSCFDLVLDISRTLDKPTLENSMRSIAVVHSLIRPAAAWYLTQKSDYLAEFKNAVEKNPELVLRNSVS
jgi:CMP/dCMP kinase